jgi:hypothetical protein
MNNIMAVFLNGIAQLEYDRDRLLPDHQAAYLDKMDAKMDAGILVGNETIKDPDQNQRPPDRGKPGKDRGHGEGVAGVGNP